MPIFIHEETDVKKKINDLSKVKELVATDPGVSKAVVFS